MTEPESAKRLRSFGRRRGRRLRTHAQELMEQLLPQLQLAATAESIAQFQKRHSHGLWLEIGFGGGEHLAHLAQHYPTIGMIGCEPYVNGISGLLKTIETQRLTNIGIYSEDVRQLLERMPDHCLDRAYILYPDPWRKARHHKRRLIQKPLLDALARTMKPASELRIATDWDDYATWILEHLLSHPDFTWTAECARDWTMPWEEWRPTRYEEKARREGRKTSYFRFTRNPILPV